MAAGPMSTAPRFRPDSDSDAALLDWVQQRTLEYFWSFAHPISGMARERSNPVAGYDYLQTVTSGGTGFGIMALIAGASRGFLPLNDVHERIGTIVRFLGRAQNWHGVFPHFLNGGTGAAIAFSDQDDGSDLVETAFLLVGLLCARQFFSTQANEDRALRNDIDRLWHAVEWDWHTQGRDMLYWHWSQNHDWAMDHPITGWNECLIAYVLAASSPTHPVGPAVYHRGWTGSPVFRNGASYYGIELPLGPPFGGPLFFSHYSFLGLDPRGLSDRYADYWQQNVAHTLINRAHCIANPNRFAGYGPACWGLTACDGDAGYDAFSPTNDRGVIAPTAALSAMPYAPGEAMDVLRGLHAGPSLHTRFGFADAFNAGRQWCAPSNLAIDQGPIVVMIENHRTGLLWDLFMSCAEIRAGLDSLGFARNLDSIFLDGSMS
jgi:hypothetical protein